MKRIILYFTVSCILLLFFLLPGVFAQEKKPFPAYIEFSLSNQGFLDSYESNVTFKGTGSSAGITQINELQFQTISLGWEFPRKGKIILTYTDFSENSSDTQIDHKLLVGNKYLADEYYDPDPFDDNYDSDPAHYLLKLRNDNLEMKTSFVDAAFMRSFGKGKRFGGSWNAGLRFAKHQQKFPMGYYYTYLNPLYGFSYTFFSSAPLLLEEKSSFMGPKGGGEMHLFLFNKRVILSGGMDVSLTFGNAEVPRQYLPRVRSAYDEFGTIVYTNEYFPFSEKRSKNPFFTIVDFNAKFRIFKELYAFIGYKIADFRDVMLSPTLVELPTSKDVAPYGVFVSFSADDVIYQTPYFGVSYQF